MKAYKKVTVNVRYFSDDVVRTSDPMGMETLNRYDDVIGDFEDIA